jgi:hypothetical protein
MSKPRKEIAALIGELKSWLPNYDHGPNDYPTILYRILANAPGAEQLEDIGYEPIGNMSWHELDQLGRVLTAIQDKRDVEDLVAGLMEDEEEDLGEARRGRREAVLPAGAPFRRPLPPPGGRTPAPVRPARPAPRPAPARSVTTRRRPPSRRK